MTRELVIAGAGITAVVQITPEAREAIVRADKVLYLLGEPFTARYIEKLNPTAESLLPLYRIGESRQLAYQHMVSRTLECLEGGDVCVVYYGHPTVLVDPASAALAEARALGYRTRVIPGISAEDCLFADLAIDPGVRGVQSYEATDFLLRPKNIETSAYLLLWQVGVLGDVRYNPGIIKPPLGVLADILSGIYGTGYDVIVYTASCHPAFGPDVYMCSVSALPAAKVTPAAMLIIPPGEPAHVNNAMRQQLGLAGEA